MRRRNARLTGVAEVKHLLPLEAPVEVANLIREQCENRVGYEEKLTNES